MGVNPPPLIKRPPPPKGPPMVKDCKVKPILIKHMVKTWKCSYCDGLVSEDKERCKNCGAPITEENRGEILKDSGFVKKYY